MSTSERVYVLVTSPDPRSFFPVEPRPELRRGHEQLVLWVGRMSRKENLPLLIDAADEIVNTLRRDDVCFALVGDGDVRPELEAEVERRGLSRRSRLPRHGRRQSAPRVDDDSRYLRLARQAEPP